MKILKSVLIAGLGLLAFAVTASAAVVTKPLANSHYLCRMVLKGLHSSGYTEGAAYSVDGINSLLTKSGVTPPDLSVLDPTKRYDLYYSCNVENRMAHPRLTAQPIDDNTQSAKVISTITWEVTG